jgi:hypothetical protein
MSLHHLPLFLPLLALASLSLNAVEVNSRGVKNPSLYGIEFPGDARAYYGREAGVLSISKQEYVTAAFKVLEVNVVTNGPALLRIYHSRPLQPGELTSSLGNAAQASAIPGGSIIQTPPPPQVETMARQVTTVADTLTSATVIKEYPYATHAHTIEFRVSSRNELLHLHDELKKHWLKEPTYFENGRIVEEGVSSQSQMKPRNLGGTLFTVTQ